MFKSGVQLYQRGEIAPAVEKAREALRIFEQLYPKSEYPDGHPYVAASLNWMGFLLHAQGTDGVGARLSRTGAGDARDPLPQGALSGGTPRPGRRLNNLGNLLRAQGAFGRRGDISSGRWRCTRPSTPRSVIRRDTPTWPGA